MTELTDDEVLKILEIVDRGHVAAFELTIGDLHIAVGPPGGPPAATPGNGSVDEQVASGRLATASQPQLGAGSADVAGSGFDAGSTQGSGAPDGQSESSEDLVDVRAPVLGIFYAAPEPGATPFVEPGSAVSADSTVGLIEIMKVFNHVDAGVAGVVVEVCAENGSLVEMGQTLMKLRPSEPTG